MIPQINYYPCPNCNADVKVGPLDNGVICPICKISLLVNSDAELVNGHWRDLTTLTILQTYAPKN